MSLCPERRKINIFYIFPTGFMIQQNVPVVGTQSTEGKTVLIGGGRAQSS
jgi:hypothetical protein